MQDKKTSEDNPKNIKEITNHKMYRFSIYLNPENSKKLRVRKLKLIKDFITKKSQMSNMYLTSREMLFTKQINLN